MNDGIRIEKPEEIIHSYIKNMVIDLQNLKDHYNKLEERVNILNLESDSLKYLLEDLADGFASRIKIPHRCPVCSGSTFDEDGALCHVCEGKGIVWGW